MSVACPVCRLAGVDGPTCRRCKADLRMYRGALTAARRVAFERLRDGDFAGALAAWRKAHGATAASPVGREV